MGFPVRGKMQRNMHALFPTKAKKFFIRTDGPSHMDFHGAFLRKILLARFKNFTKPHVRTKFKNKIVG